MLVDFTFMAARSRCIILVGRACLGVWRLRLLPTNHLGEKGRADCHGSIQKLFCLQLKSVFYPKYIFVETLQRSHVLIIVKQSHLS